MKSIKDVKAPSKVTKSLLTAVNHAASEKGVENAYWEAIKETFKSGQPSDAESTDGYLDIKYSEGELFLLMEFKYSKHLEKRSHAVEVIIQTIFYMHTMRDKFAKVPNMILIGDKHHAFAMNTKPLIKYLDDDVDWSVSPSSAAETYRTSMVIDLYNDDDINYYLHDINDPNFTFQSLVKDIITLASDTGEKIKITPSNINAAFDQFINQVVESNKRFSAEQLVGVFVEVATNRQNIFLSENGTKLRVGNLVIKVNKANYRSFIGHFEDNYKPSEKRIFTETSDRLIQDYQRRASGEFYTPSAFVDYAINRLSQQLGDDWTNEYVVWDPAWGTGNLTRDNHFESLYASTLYQSDLMQGKQYNTNATKFVFDFLNDDTDFETNNLFGYTSEKLPQSLIEVLTQHPESKICFFMNPPYGTAGNARSSRKSKAGIAKTIINVEMAEKHLKVQEQLYAQFLYRIIKMKQSLNLSNVAIGLFSPSLLLTGSKFDKFRKLLFDNFELVESNLFNAGNFADTKQNWAINFSIWKTNNKNNQQPYEFDANVLKLNTSGDVSIIGHKLLYNTDSPNVKSLQQFLSDNTDKPSKMVKTILQFSSRYTTRDKKIEVPKNEIGYIINDTNNVEASVSGSYLMPSPITRHLTTAIITKNTFLNQMVVFASRNAIDATWVNNKDEFLAPNTKTKEFKRLQAKSAIFSIFHSANNILSYRSDFHEAGCINLNNWFFMSADEIKELADEFSNSVIYEDTIENANKPVMYQLLNELELDEQDKQLLNTAKAIVKHSFKYRDYFNDDNPEYAVNCWDASWNQIAMVAKNFLPDELKEFNKLFSSYRETVQELVYKNKMLLDSTKY